eukprot:14199003-Ditylum_brightwellii.AAC.1
MSLRGNNEASIADGLNAKFLFGADMGSLKGKTTRKVLEPVINDYIEVPWEITDLHNDVIIAADVMYINK